MDYYSRRVMDDRRVADYFVVAGLDPHLQLPLEEFSNEAITKPSVPDPITDITVINRSLGEKIPKGFECIETTPTGYPANLNHGSMRWCPDMYICFRRGRDKPPLKDLGILYEGKERVMEGCEVVHTTMQGNPANVNNSNSSRIYITYRRADKCASSDTLVVVDICVILGSRVGTPAILGSRGEEPPLTFLKIPKNLNKGVLGSDVYLCYKKAVVKNDVLAYKASILGRYPMEDYPSFPLPESVPMFCLPMGATIECWSADAQHPVPNFSTFILTGAGGEKVYGAAVGFYEEFREDDLTDLQMRSLGLKNKSIREQYRIQKTVHVRKSIALLSHWPFFDAFKKFLSQLYKISITGPHTVPIERHISHFMYDVPYPSPERPRILVQLTHESLSLCMPQDSPLPQSGASFITMLRNLAPELTMNLLLFVLLENKILLHSLRPTVLTEVAEAVSTMIFPFHWQCPYIPLCPLGLSDVLNAPCPFIVGVDSRYFDLYDPPADVICVDLDTNRIAAPEDKKSLNYKMLPKKATRVMQESLSTLYEQASLQNMKNHESDEVSLEMTHFDLDFRHKKQTMQLELAIQEVFLRFMSSILKDYKNFLNPITKQPTIRTTDAQTLFDMPGFLKSRDKANTKFFSQLMRTQMLYRFIEERSFVSDNDASLAFFDECTEKVDEMRDEPKLIETDNSQTSERTVFIMPPEPTGLPEGLKYSYNGFPTLKPELFLMKQKSNLSLPTKPVCPNSPLARRTKQEVKAAQKVAMVQAENPEAWAKCLLSYSYSLWFVVFPAFVQAHPKKIEALKIGFAVLCKMQDSKLHTIDEFCYRVLMQLAGQYNKPGLAIQIFSQMKKYGVHPNAITYGYYNKVMLEAKWPSPQSKGRLRWLKIRNVIIGVAQFRRAIRRRSLSLYSNSGSEFDQISHASVDSYLGMEGHGQPKVNGEATVVAPDSGRMVKEGPVTEEGKTANGSIEERMSTGGVSDRGYNSMTQEDVKRMSQIVISASEDNGSASSPATSENSDKPHNKSKAEGWGFSNFLSGSGHFSKSGHHGAKARKVHIVDPDGKPTEQRPRLGSIVKRSNSKISSNNINQLDEYEVLKGSLLVNSSGLVIVSEACLRKSSIAYNVDIQLEMEAAKRRRHRSETHTKPSRSMSLFASWRPLKNSSQTADQSAAYGVRYSELVHTEEDDSSIASSNVHSTEGKHGLTNDSSAADLSSETTVAMEGKGDSVTVQCPSQQTSLPEGNTALSSNTPTEPSVDATDSSHILKTDDSCPNTLVLEVDPLSGETNTETDSTQLDTQNEQSKIMTTRNESDQSLLDQASAADSSHLEEQVVAGGPRRSSAPASSVTTTNSAQEGTSLGQLVEIETTGQTTAGTGGSDTPLSRQELRRSMSISEDRLSNHVNEIPLKQSLSEVGRTLSSGSDIPKTPVGRKEDDTFSVSSLTEPKTSRPSDFMMKRTHSLKKTNEVIGSFFKSASRAAYNKLNELKQTITTPIKNGSLSSLGSLTQSVEELDVNDGSSTSGTIREKQRYGGSQDLLSHSEESVCSDPDKRFSGLSFETAPSPSYLNNYKTGSETASASSITTTVNATDGSGEVVAMEVEMSSCSRCTKCCRLIYDEEILAGWSAEDSNLNTSCPYCHAKFVPHLQIYIKDWRGHEKPVVFEGEQSRLAKEKLLAMSDGTDGAKASKTEAQTGKTEEIPTEMQSSLEKGEHLLSLEEAGNTIRRRCTSECLVNAGDDISLGPMDSPTYNLQRSPLSLSIEEETPESHSTTAQGDLPLVSKEFMTRSASSTEPQVVPYLSPLVLRKEVEFVMDHEGNLCLAQDNFVEEHPIIFWNLVWFFRRIEVPTHLTGFLLTSKAFSCNKTQEVEKHKGQYSFRNILIRPQWDNIRIHDEVGLPMYSAWRAGNKSTVVNALIIEPDSFPRPLLWHIIADIKNNDVLSAIRRVALARKRMSPRKRRFRSMYREILFLSFADCGRESIDHDAFDREYTFAFEQKMKPVEVNRLQPDDRPKSLSVQCCRRVFCDLEV